MLSYKIEADFPLARDLEVTAAVVMFKSSIELFSYLSIDDSLSSNYYYYFYFYYYYYYYCYFYNICYELSSSNVGLILTYTPASPNLFEGDIADI